MKKINQLIIAVIALTFASCNSNTTNKPEDKADAIYFSGDIITMEGNEATYAEAVAVKDGKIVFVGSKADAVKMKSDATVMNNLQGKTLLPGFLDPHSHFINALSMTTQANCFAPPVGTAGDVKGIIASLKELQKKNNIPNGEIIMGYGY